jgi:hypothetical protein
MVTEPFRGRRPPATSMAQDGGMASLLPWLGGLGAPGAARNAARVLDDWASLEHDVDALAKRLAPPHDGDRSLARPPTAA